MKTTLKFALVYFILGMIAVTIYGCATEHTLVPYKPAVTNVDGTITPAVPAVKEFVPNETVTKGVATAEQFVKYVPDPYKTPIEGGLALATAIAGLVAGFQNRQAKKHKSVADTIVAGVEAAGAAADAVKASISKQALSDGNADLVHTAVKALKPNS